MAGYVEDLATFRSRLGSDLQYPNVVLGALRNIDARHTLQNVWPEVIIDGAIGDFSWASDESKLLSEYFLRLRQRHHLSGEFLRMQRPELFERLTRTKAAPPDDTRPWTTVRALALRAMPTMIERECGLSTAHAPATNANSVSIAALSAAPLCETAFFPDHFGVVSDPVSLMEGLSAAAN